MEHLDVLVLLIEHGDQGRDVRLLGGRITFGDRQGLVVPGELRDFLVPVALRFGEISVVDGGGSIVKERARALRNQALLVVFTLF